MNATENFTTIYDNGLSGDQHVRLEESEDGLLYETNNASTRQCVCSALFAGWPGESPERDGLVQQFGSEEIADRYIRAAKNLDK